MEIQSAVKFEENYIYKNCRSISSTPDIALTELIANTWDAGAFNVNINIPDNENINSNENDVICIEDDGTGMTDDEFRQRWMTLNYDRKRRQGIEVEFPEERKGQKRLSYGRNGIGRHGMFCFSKMYTVETWKNGICNKYDITIDSGDNPFSISNHSSYDKNGHGTKIYASIQRNFPKVNEIIDIIGARFLYDPNFNVTINNQKIVLSDYPNILLEEEKTIENIKLIITVIDSTKTAIKSSQSGIAFWICGRLVDRPTWTYGDVQFLDARFKPAKKYTIIVKTDDLIDDVLPDWSGFMKSPKMDLLFSELKKITDEIFHSIIKEQIIEIQKDIIEFNRDELEKLQILEKREISAFIEEIMRKSPLISQDYLNLAVAAMINIQKSRKGVELLEQLSKMQVDKVEKLSDLLKNWDIDDIVTVLDEINRRILVIEAISKLHCDKTVDELSTLHPIVLNARWLFGAEFDSPMFTSNETLNTVIKKIFKEKDNDKNYLENPKRRPDIVVLGNSSIKAVCTDRGDDSNLTIMKPDQILIIELKRGGFEISSEEVSQAENYTRQIKKAGELHAKSTIHTFVVGTTIGDIDQNREMNSGKISVVTYAQLIETAQIRLFRLREKLKNHYEEIGTASIVEEALRASFQMKI